MNTGAAAEPGVGTEPAPIAPPATRDALRRLLRSRRAALGEAQRHAAAQSITRHIAATHWLHGMRRIGLYVSVGYEVRTEALRALARRRHCPVYLPRIADYRRRVMVFTREREPLRLLNRHGIPEPAAAHRVAARALSVVFVPLLGFDLRGTRLGAGAGYYDRLFAYRRHRHSWQRPLLIGLAYSCQRVERIERAGHDVPLDAVVTEAGVLRFTRPAG
ncbi:MAG: 5-formyltetrahydrofolate cyclo-ligase [Steroidobacteraceae bacterium]